jgi:serine/threonine protein kinase
MLVKVVCPNPDCRTSFAVPEDVIGRTGRCVECGRTFPMQAAGSVSPSASMRIGGTRVNSSSAVLDRPHDSSAIGPGPLRDSHRLPIPEQFGRYRILRPIGQGGMGSVYLAFDTQLERQVALKIPHFGTDDGKSVLDRFYLEAKVAATFDHPNLCPIFDVGEVGGVPYLTMPYMVGRPLSETIDPANLLPPREVVSIVRKLASALAEAHRLGIIHRDLKPANVMVREGRDLVIMDFGLACRGQAAAESRLTSTGAVLGTPSYMAPEQVHGDLDAIGPRTDIYSLGVILYEFLTGRLPFQGPPALVMGLIAVMEPPHPSTHRPDHDPGLEAVCLKAMARKVEDRFASMDEFATALGSSLDSGNADSASDSARGSNDEVPVIEIGKLDEFSLRPHKPSRDRPRRLYLVGAAALGLLVLGVILSIRVRNGSIQITLSEPNARVAITVDGEEVTLERPDRKILVKAGDNHILRVTGEGFEPVAESFTLGPEEQKVLTVTLRRISTVAGNVGDPIKSVVMDSEADEWFDPKEAIDLSEDKSPKLAEALTPARKEEKLAQEPATPPGASVPSVRDKAALEKGANLCFRLNDWKAGLPFFRDCGDELFRAVAMKELAGPGTVAERVELANMWVALSKKANKQNYVPFLRRAKYWYLGALARSDGVEKARILGEARASLSRLRSATVVIDFVVKGIDGSQDIQISNDGVRSISCSHGFSSILIDGRLPWETGPNRMVPNSNNTIVLPNVVNFATARVINLKEGANGNFRIKSQDEESIVLRMVHPPAGRCNFSFTIAIE